MTSEQDVRDLEGDVRANLSAEQFEKVAISGSNLLVTACPGSGKTRATAGRAALKIASGSRLALLSYTNVGADELRAAVLNDYGVVLDDHHFVGTLHSFLIKYVYEPFGNLVMDCPSSPKLRTLKNEKTLVVGGGEVRFDDFTVQNDGSFIFSGRRPPEFRVSNLNVASLGREAVFAEKTREAQSGTALLSDALYWAFKVLEQHPEIGSALAERFNEIIIDEAQDTTSVQADCLQLICFDSPVSLCLVGDFEQSIYSFAGASPAAINRLASNLKLEPVRLNENHRSSQRICAVAASLWDGRTPDLAVGEYANYPDQPTLYVYPSNEPRRILDQFSEDLLSSGISESGAFVLARKNKLLSSLAGGKGLELPKDSPIAAIAHSLPRAGSGLELSRVRSVEEVVGGLTVRSEKGAGDDGLRIRTETIRLITALPREGISLEAWAALASVELVRIQQDLLERGDSLGVYPDLSYPGADGALFIEDYLANPLRTDGFNFKTIHAVKGMSFDALLLVAEPFSDFRGLESEVWGSCFGKGNGRILDMSDQGETLRTLYVGLTRARKVCRIGIPDSSSAECIAGFISAGFRVVRLR